MNDKVFITTDTGERVEATAPVIISASRATDIPAFYAEWLFNRLERGYCAWQNPFNRKKQYVSFDRCRAIVLWTKNPAPILPYLPRLDSRGIHYYFQVTLNDYEPEHLEPNVPPLKERIDTFRQLSRTIGPERVVWRFDPLILIPGSTPRDLLKRVWNVGQQLKGFTRRLTVSFADISCYRKVQANLIRQTEIFNRENVGHAEPSSADIAVLADGLSKMQSAWRQSGWDIEIVTCSETADLSDYGIGHGSCIDGMLMEKAFGHDRELLYFLRCGKLPERNLFGDLPDLPDTRRDLKDKGQRKACGCITAKDIGMYNTCPHLCAYCYANASPDKVLAAPALHSPLSESILPFS